MGAEISSSNLPNTKTLGNLQLDDIPNEIILKILRKLKLKYLLICAQVCKRINVICMDETLYHKMDFSRRTIPTRIVELALQRGCKNLSLRHSKLKGKFSGPLPKVLNHLDLFRCK